MSNIYKYELGKNALFYKLTFKKIDDGQLSEAATRGVL